MITTNHNIVFDTFDRLRFPVALFVVWEHLTTRQGTIIHGERFDPSDYMGFNIPVLFGDGFMLDPLAVPIFLFISGYLFFRSGTLTKQEYYRKISSRTKTLLLPYIVWNAIAILLIVAKSNIHGRYTLNLDITNILSAFWIYKGGLVNDPLALEIPDCEWFAPVLGPLWYLRNLFLLCLISPIIFWCLKKFSQIFVLIVSIGWLTSFIWTQSDLIRSSIESLAFFSWGGASSLIGEKSLKQFHGFWKPMIIVGGLFSLAYFLLSFQYGSFGVWIKRINSFIMVVALIGLSYNLSIKGRSFNKFLSGSSLFVYIVHLLIGGIIVKVCLMIFPINNYSIFPIYLFAIAITILVILSGYWVVGRLPSSLQFLLLGKNVKN